VEGKYNSDAHYNVKCGFTVDGGDIAQVLLLGNGFEGTPGLR